MGVWFSDELRRATGQRQRAYGTDRTARSADRYTASGDLALEAHERVSRERAGGLPGVDVKRDDDGAIAVTRLTVKTLEGAQQMQKAQGTYTTLEVPDLRKRDLELQKRVSIRFAEEFQGYIERVADCRHVLVIGLGNWHVTPDSLGPQVVERLFITRHLFGLMPDVMATDHRSVCALAPGVLGLTGLETWEVVTAVANQVAPDVIVAIDALASRSLERVNATIQISDAGIAPGSGVGNKRRALSRDTLGVPVLAVGVPTVVDAATIASDAMDLLLLELEKHVPGNDAGRLLNQFDHDEKRRLVAEVLQPLDNNLVVTPKDIDEFVVDIATVVATGLNIALHDGLTFEEARALMM